MPSLIIPLKIPLFIRRKSWDEFIIDFPEEFYEEEAQYLLPIDISLELPQNILNTEWNDYLDK